LAKKLQVFISSTYLDLIEERQIAVEAILQSRNIPAGMELFAAANESQLETVKRWIDESDIYLLILGGRYGSIEEKSGKSYTHLEYEYAIKKLPVIGIVLDDNIINNKVKSYGTEMIELENRDKYNEFKKLVMGKTCALVKDIKDIPIAIIKSIREAEEKHKMSGWISGKPSGDYNELISKNIELRNENIVLNQKVQRLEKEIRKFSSISCTADLAQLSKNDFIYALINRFLKVYEIHDVAITQIYTFVDKKYNLELKDFKDSDSIINIISDDLLNWTASTFGIKREWLDGTDERIYQTRDYYKNIHTAINDFIKLLDKGYEIDVFFLKSSNILNNQSEKDQPIGLIVRMHFDEGFGKKIYKYKIIRTYWNWGYWRTRYQLKALIWLFRKLDIDFDGYDIDKKELDGLLSGKVFPQTIVDNLRGVTWYPDDYIDSSDSSIQAKETDERELVYRYFYEERYYHSLINCFEEKELQNSFLKLRMQHVCDNLKDAINRLDELNKK
jgi:hypothetical protein